ncbi:MAG TPA: mRNA-degrading endonuclease, partial [Syntrophaceae bacterium]|nr:mRNA-degrading endonuclease [Syntrophaceae bacterium]
NSRKIKFIEKANEKTMNRILGIVDSIISS